MTSIQAPTHCPSCNFVLEWVNNILYCRNVACSAKNSKAVEHFAKTMKIKGLGPAAIEKLDLSDITEIYLLEKEDIAAALSSEKLASRLFAEIQNSKQAPANFVLPALGIPLIGKTATEKLSTVVDNILDIDTDSCTKAGLGPKATENLMSWIEGYGESILYFFCNLPLNLSFVKKQQSSVRQGVVCISGKLTSFRTKADAASQLEKAGYVVKSSLTKDVTHLINESGIESAKTKQARDSGVIIITNILEFLGE